MAFGAMAGAIAAIMQAERAIANAIFHLLTLSDFLCFTLRMSIPL
jgi:hypothetical protein